MFRCQHQLVSTWALLAAAAGLSVSCTLVSLKPHSSYAFLALAVYASFVTWQHYNALDRPYDTLDTAYLVPQRVRDKQNLSHISASEEVTDVLCCILKITGK